MFESRYHTIMANRREGLRKYGGRFTSDIYGPPVRVAFPTFHVAPPCMPSVRIGPIYVADNPPILAVVRRVLAGQLTPVHVLEIGPGEGRLAAALRAEFADRIGEYYGLELDESVRGPYTRVATVLEALEPKRLVIASEVIEHMPPQTFFGDIVVPMLPTLAPDAVMVVGTPNALAPASIFADFTHVQAYPWYDLYALLRLFFEEVDVLRTRYVWSAKRLASLIPRVLVAHALELDWCEGFICVARRPTGQ